MKPKPLTPKEREKMFGKFTYVKKTDGDGGIRITDDFVHENIVTVELPTIAYILGGRTVRCHRLIDRQLCYFFEAVDKTGLTPKILTWNGCYVPRLMRGSDTKLSNHSWGTAFDINAAWNPLGRTPAADGHKGSVREIVDLAESCGFFWGGNFKSRPDGMHFECVKIL